MSRLTVIIMTAVIGVVVIVGVVVLVMKPFAKNDQTAGTKQDQSTKTTDASIRPCPANLTGILTYPLMEPKYISALTPLGNINPPGHTAPVDHIYFATNETSRIPLHAPANAVITSIIAETVKNSQGKYVPSGYVVQYTVCDGLVLDFASYTDVIQPIKDELAKQTPECFSDISKVEHLDQSGQCSYHLSFPVTSGQEIGWVQRVSSSDGFSELPFEIWAANYNQSPPSQTNWSYYNDDRYAHIICPFDLYGDDLKTQFEKKFGRWESGDYKDPFTGTITPNPSGGFFIPRTIAPLCGQVDQDLTDTIQGMWFNGPPKASQKDGNIDSTGQGLAIVHDNLNPQLGVISIGGELTGAIEGAFLFVPSHSGRINREPSEVTADGQTYCYDQRSKSGGDQSMFNTKILIQLVDAHHLIASNQTGDCTGQEKITKQYVFER